MCHIVEKDELSGFDLVGWRRKDGKLALGISNKEEAEKSVKLIDNFPKTATFKGDFNIYDLEKVKKQGDGLEWGLYV